MKTGLSASFVLSVCLAAQASRAADGFSFDDKPGDHLDVLLDGKIVARYMDGHDTSTPARRDETYKPYLHVFDADGKAPITQGAGGKLFPHHRGIFAGWMKIGVDGKTYDRWHMKGGDQVHEKFIEQKADADSATITSLVQWDGASADKPILIEERTMTFRRAPAPARLMIDFTTKLKSTGGDVTLDGDPEHSGVQYRPAGQVDVKQTVYLYPKAEANAHKDLDYPWVAETYALDGKKYSVIDLNSPENPRGSRISAYRDYGRFGFFPKATIKAGDTLTLKYRFLIADGEMPALEMIEKAYDAFTGAGAASALPQTTLKPAEQSGTPKPKVAKPKAS
jgi:hypothetical protein